MDMRTKAALLAVVLKATPAYAVETVADNDTLLSEVRRLGQRVEQLEVANIRLEARLAEHRNPEREQSFAHRIEDIELEVLTMRKQTRMIETVEGISAGAALTMVAQRADGDATRSGKSESQLNYRADVSVTLPAGEIGDAQGQLFGHFRLGQGKGLTDLNPTLTGTANSTAFQLANGDDSAALLAQAWYQLDVPLGVGKEATPSHLEINLGKIDPFVFFDQNGIADDESARFLNNVFVHNPLLDSGGDVGVDAYGFSPGARIAYHNDSHSPNWWRVSLGAFGAGQGASFSDSLSSPFLIGQVEMGGKVIGELEGTWRLYAWSNGRAIPYANESDGGSERHTGWGVSVDQQVAGHASLFARYGQSTRGHVKFDRAVTLGAELSGGWWGRAGDRLGLALGWLRTSQAFRADAPLLDADGDLVADFGYTPSGAERQAEIYYAWRINDHLELSPDVQYIQRPGGDTSRKDMTILGLRARMEY